MYNIDAYRRLRHLKAGIKMLDEMYALTSEDKRRMSRNLIPRSWDELTCQIGYDAGHAVKRLYHEYCAELRAVRVFLNNPPTKRPFTIGGIVEGSLKSASFAVNAMFSKNTFSVVTSAAPSFEAKTSFYGDHKIGIPKVWLRSVYERGLANVQGSDDSRFIMSAKKRRHPHETAEIYEVVALKRNTELETAVHGPFSLEYGWVAKADGVSAYSTDVQKALRLLHRRVRAKIMKELLGG